MSAGAENEASSLNDGATSWWICSVCRRQREAAEQEVGGIGTFTDQKMKKSDSITQSGNKLGWLFFLCVLFFLSNVDLFPRRGADGDAEANTVMGNNAKSDDMRFDKKCAQINGDGREWGDF